MLSSLNFLVKCFQLWQFGFLKCDRLFRGNATATINSHNAHAPPDEIMSTPTNQSPQGTAELTLRLHDFLSVGEHFCKAIDEIVAKYKLGKKCAEDLMTLKDGMSLQHNEVNQLVGKV